MRKLTLLYTNSPNPIVLERVSAFASSKEIDLTLIYGERKNSKISMPFEVNQNVNFRSIQIEDYRGFDIKRIFNILKIYNVARKEVSDVYAFYPDMLLVGVIIKILSISKKIRLHYEIQDLHYDNFFYRLFHNSLMTLCDNIFITSNGFRKELLPGFKSLLNKKIEYISNAPSVANFKDLRVLTRNLFHKEFANSFETLGFVGNLRDEEQLRAIKYFLEHTKINILQAGASDFSSDLYELEKKFNKRLIVLNNYHQRQLGSIWGMVDYAWCVYPETYNYKHHIARRLHEAMYLRKKVIVSETSKENISYLQQHSYPFVTCVPGHYQSYTDALNRLNVFQKTDDLDFKVYESYDDFAGLQIRKILELN